MKADVAGLKARSTRPVTLRAALPFQAHLR